MSKSQNSSNGSGKNQVSNEIQYPEMNGLLFINKASEAKYISNKQSHNMDEIKKWLEKNKRGVRFDQQ